MHTRASAEGGGAALTAAAADELGADGAAGGAPAGGEAPEPEGEAVATPALGGSSFSTPGVALPSENRLPGSQRMVAVLERTSTWEGPSLEP